MAQTCWIEPLSRFHGPEVVHCRVRTIGAHFPSFLVGSRLQANREKLGVVPVLSLTEAKRRIPNVRSAIGRGIRCDAHVAGYLKD